MSTTEAAAGSGSGIHARLAGVARHLNRLSEKRQRGRLAELRRLQSRREPSESVRPSELPGEAFWNMVHQFDIPRSEEDFWLAVLPLMVRHPHQHQPKLRVPPGRALEAAGISKPRFERWLRLDREGARREAPRLLSKLKDQGLDWVKLGHTLYRWSDDDRYTLARDFFLARERRDRKHTQTDGAD